MKFGIYCSNLSDQNLEAVRYVINCLEKERLAYSIFDELEKVLKSGNKTFIDQKDLEESADILITIGGDGTILNAVRFVYGNSIPVVGVNTGRLGYLTSITPDEFKDALLEINRKTYKIEERNLLQIMSSEDIGFEKFLALNEVSVLKKDSSSMITINAYLDGDFLNTYWADGLIISTSTGSTAYSLSCGGPILTPGSGNFIITPIAPHNLNVRPLVIPDTSLIELSFESRSDGLLLALDSNSCIISDKVKISIKKADKKIALLRSENYNYLETLRSKLNWGLDQRN